MEFSDILREDYRLGNAGLAGLGPSQVGETQGMLWDQGLYGRTETTTISTLLEGRQNHGMHHQATLNGSFTSILPSWDVVGTSMLEPHLPNIHPVATTQRPIEGGAAGKGLKQPNCYSNSLGGGEESIEVEEDTHLAVHRRRDDQLQAMQRGIATEPSLMARVLIGQIQNYPRMLIQGSKLPPFIYPQCVLDDRVSRQCTAMNGMHQCLPEPLANCAAMVQMFYSRGPSNTHLVWKTIYVEQKRLYQQVSNDLMHTSSPSYR
ncbi:putative sterigmatocystin biosynthesis regulatory protein [Rosellinia necatrix]|uniref:Putative sterigmatocystin biosynthesis regulatory protein n=1 Tax=Rosellinia necatrix TaxID=77044 RepID=A0A1S8A4S5_ROSNE|nr:putative sterigmatocystin biosynthesis regulatory protein [Rosellinia necatrix]